MTWSFYLGLWYVEIISVFSSRSNKVGWTNWASGSSPNEITCSSVPSGVLTAQIQRLLPLGHAAANDLNFVFLHTNAYMIEWSLCFLTDGKIDPTSLSMWDKRCYMRDNEHATFDVMTFQIIGLCRVSTFATLACATAIQNSKRLQLLYLSIKISSVGMRFLSKNNRNILIPNCLTLLILFLFRSSSPDSSTFKQRE